MKLMVAHYNHLFKNLYRVIPVKYTAIINTSFGRQNQNQINIVLLSDAFKAIEIMPVSKIYSITKFSTMRDCINF